MSGRTGASTPARPNHNLHNRGASHGWRPFYRAAARIPSFEIRDPEKRSATQGSRKRIKAAIGVEIGHLHKTHALLIAIQFAANHEAEFDVSDALAVVVVLIAESLAGLDRLEAAS